MKKSVWLLVLVLLGVMFLSASLGFCKINLEVDKHGHQLWYNGNKISIEEEMSIEPEDAGYYGYLSNFVTATNNPDKEIIVSHNQVLDYFKLPVKKVIKITEKKMLYDSKERKIKIWKDVSTKEENTYIIIIIGVLLILMISTPQFKKGGERK